MIIRANINSRITIPIPVIKIQGPSYPLREYQLITRFDDNGHFLTKSQNAHVVSSVIRNP